MHIILQMVLNAGEFLFCFNYKGGIFYKQDRQKSFSYSIHLPTLKSIHLQACPKSVKVVNTKQCITISDLLSSLIKLNFRLMTVYVCILL